VISYRLIHTDLNYTICMATSNLHALVEGLAARLEWLNLSGDDQEEFSTMLCRLEDQADQDQPNHAIVEECVAFLSRPQFRVSSAPAA
jgi:hypothetical protein